MESNLDVPTYSILEEAIYNLQKGLELSPQKKTDAIANFYNALLEVSLASGKKEGKEEKLIYTCAQILVSHPHPHEVPPLYRRFINTPYLAERVTNHLQNLLLVYTRKRTLLGEIAHVINLTWAHSSARHKLQARLLPTWEEVIAQSMTLLNSGNASATLWGELTNSAFNLSLTAEEKAVNSENWLLLAIVEAGRKEPFYYPGIAISGHLYKHLLNCFKVAAKYEVALKDKSWGVDLGLGR